MQLTTYNRDDIKGLLGALMEKVEANIIIYNRVYGHTGLSLATPLQIFCRNGKSVCSLLKIFDNLKAYS